MIHEIIPLSQANAAELYELHRRLLALRRAVQSHGGGGFGDDIQIGEAAWNLYQVLRRAGYGQEELIGARLQTNQH